MQASSPIEGERHNEPTILGPHFVGFKSVLGKSSKLEQEMRIAALYKMMRAIDNDLRKCHSDKDLYHFLDNVRVTVHQNPREMDFFKEKGKWFPRSYKLMRPFINEFVTRHGI